ncbi:MAG: preprotein translocase subunit SecE [Pirellula sp.]|jgi:preprotein translocase subunit SecE|nr:preprotein translocase subunit SecE [Pirellula sp.]
MATITDDTLNRSFGSELFTNARYKPKQGRLVRQLTCLAIWLACWLGAWQLFEAMGAWTAPLGNAPTNPFWSTSRYWMPAGLTALGMWLGYRLINWPRFADFLISVEAELNKVSWPKKTELYRASMVVIFTMALLALLLFCYDAIWQWLFDTLGVS